MLAWTDAQSEAADHAVETATGGTAAVLVVEGSPGAGKSSFLRMVADRADGFHATSVDCEEHDREPFAALHRAGVPIPRSFSPLVAAQALRDHLEDVGDHRAQLLIVDDAQWMDVESLRAIVALLDGSAHDRLLVVLGGRRFTGDPRPELQRRAERIGARIVLDRMDVAVAHRIARDEHPTISDTTVERVWRLTDGNPLYFTAALRAHTERELSTIVFLPAPEDFARVVARRLDSVGAQPAEFLRACAVLGSQWSPLPIVTALAGVDSPRHCVEALTEEGLLEHRLSTDEVVRPAHALVRAAVYQSIPLEDRQRLHLAAADLATDEHDAFRHRVAAADGADDGLADELRNAARRNHEAGAFRRAADEYRWAGRLTSDAGGRRARHLDSLLEHVLAGDVESALFDLRTYPDQSDDRVALIAALIESTENRWSEAVRVLQPVLDRPVGDSDPLSRYRCEVLAAWCGLGAGLSTEWIRAALDRADALGAVDPAFEGYSAVARVQLISRIAGVDGARAFVADLPASPADVPREGGYALLVRGILRLDDGDGRGAVADLEELERRFQAGLIDVGNGNSVNYASLGTAYWLAGDQSRADVKFRTAQRLQGRLIHPMASAMTALGPIAAGDFETAAAALDLVHERLTREPWQEAWDWYVVARVTLLHARRDERAQSAEFARFESDFDPRLLGARTPRFPFLLVHRILLSVWADRREEVASLLPSLDTHADALPWARGAATWLRGLVAEREGAASRARRLYDDALSAGLTGIPLLHAHLLADRARVGGDDAEPALAAYRALGQVAYARSERGPAHGGDGMLEPLSERERDVFALVTSGLSYAQIAKDLFISRSTVSFHLSRIYAKTGVTSRHELTALARAEH